MLSRDESSAKRQMQKWMVILSRVTSFYTKDSGLVKVWNSTWSQDRRKATGVSEIMSGLSQNYEQIGGPLQLKNICNTNTLTCSLLLFHETQKQNKLRPYISTYPPDQFVPNKPNVKRKLIMLVIPMNLPFLDSDI